MQLRAVVALLAMCSFLLLVSCEGKRMRLAERFGGTSLLREQSDTPPPPPTPPSNIPDAPLGPIPPVPSAPRNPLAALGGRAAAAGPASTGISPASTTYATNIVGDLANFDMRQHNVFMEELLNYRRRTPLPAFVEQYRQKLISMYLSHLGRTTKIPIRQIVAFKKQYVNKYVWLGLVTRQKFTKDDDWLPHKYGLFMVVPHKVDDISAVRSNNHVFKLFPTVNPKNTVELFGGNAHNRNLFYRVAPDHTKVRTWAIKGAGFDCTRKYLGDINNVFRDQLYERCDEMIKKKYLPFFRFQQGRDTYKKFGYDSDFSTDYDGFEKLERAFDAAPVKDNDLKRSLPRAVAVVQMVFTHADQKNDEYLQGIPVQQLVYSTIPESPLRVPRYMHNCASMWHNSVRACHARIKATPLTSDMCSQADVEIYRFHKFTEDADCLAVRKTLTEVVYPTKDRSTLNLGTCGGKLPADAVMPPATKYEKKEDGSFQHFHHYGYYQFDWDKEAAEWLSYADQLMPKLKVPVEYNSNPSLKLAYKWIYSMLADFGMFVAGGLTCKFQSDSFEGRNFVFSVRDNDGWGEIVHDDLTVYQAGDLFDVSESLAAILFSTRANCASPAGAKLYELVNMIREFFTAVGTEFWKASPNARGKFAFSIKDDRTLLKIGCPENPVNENLRAFCQTRFAYRDDRLIKMEDITNLARLNSRLARVNRDMFRWFFGLVGEAAIGELFKFAPVVDE